MNHVPTENLAYSTFAGLEQTRFQVRAAQNAFVELTLVEVRLSGGHEGQESFSLLFHGPLNPLLPQQVYGFEQPQIGAFELFIVPVGREAGSIQYQAIFNRLAKRG